MRDCVLTLETLVERPVVCVDKADYPLRLPQDFGLGELARIERMQRTLSGLLGQGADLSDGQIAQMATLLGELVALVLPEMPPVVAGRLSDSQRLAIIRAFQAAAGAEATIRPPMASLPIGGS